MTLRKQLFLVSLCLLVLPWAGCQYVKEMETVLRQNQQHLLQSAAVPIAQLVTPTLLQAAQQYGEEEAPPLYASFRDTPIALDGYEDEWSHFPSTPLTHSEGSTGYVKLSVSQHNLLLLIHINDPDIHYHRPNTPPPLHSDHLRITTHDGTQSRTFAFYTSGQGAIQSRQWIDRSRNRWKPLPSTQPIHGYWLEVEHGYTVELSIPLTLLHSHITLSAFNVNDTTGSTQATLTASTGQRSLLTPIAALTSQLYPFHPSPWDIAIVNPQGWVLSPQSHHGRNASAALTETSSPMDMPLWKTALSHIYRFILEDVITSEDLSPWPLSHSTPSLAKHPLPLSTLTDSQGQWYRLAQSQRSILSINHPIYDAQQDTIVGYVILTQANDALLTSTNNALLRVVNISIGTTALSALALLGYASLLSFRIRALRNLTEQAVSHDGKVSTFTASTAQDEIGDLSRSYHALLTRIQDYNQYLETLSGKLAHELRTPLTISKSSLEMLRLVDPNDTEKQQRYFERAEMGIERLRRLLNAMSEASRVEQSIQQSELHPLDLFELLEHMRQAYQDSYPSHHFDYPSDSQQTSRPAIMGNPELLAQMLDKLIDNAVGFAPDHSTITLALTPRGQHLQLTIANQGPLLPDNMQQQLFDSLVSVRQETSDKAHLGLGLYIVKLIVQHHQGALSARNADDGQGVIFSIELPTC